MVERGLADGNISFIPSGDEIVGVKISYSVNGLPVVTNIMLKELDNENQEN